MNKLLWSLSMVFCLSLFMTVDMAYGQKKSKRDKKKSEEIDIAEDLDIGKEQEAEYYFTEGMRFALIEKNDKAIKLFEKALDLMPGNAAINYKIADIYTIDGAFEKAIPYAQKAVSLEDNNEAYYLLLARIFEFQEDYASAEKTLRAMMSKISGTEEHYFDLAILQTYLGNYEEALSTYDKMQSIYGINPDISLQKQRLYLQLNKLDEAISEGQELINSFPNEEEFIFNQIKLMLSNDRMDEAQKAIDVILQSNPGNAEALMLLSDVYRSRNEYDSANVALQRAFESNQLSLEKKVAILANLSRFAFEESDRAAIKILANGLVRDYPDEERAHAIRGDVMLQFQEKEKALDSYKKAVNLEDVDMLIWTNIILIEFEMQRFDSVTYYAARALELFPNQGRIWFMKGLGHYSNGNHTDAKTSLERAKKLTSADDQMLIDILSALGDTYNNLEEYEKSDEAYDHVLKISPDNEHVMNNYSYFLSLRGDNLEKAKSMSSSLVARFPENDTYLDTHAWVLYKMGDYDNALKFLSKALEFTESGVIMEHYGDVLFKLGRTEEAIDFWKKAAKKEDASELIHKKISDGQLYE